MLILLICCFSQQLAFLKALTGSLYTTAETAGDGMTTLTIAMPGKQSFNSFKIFKFTT